MPCNTAHRYFQALKQCIKIPLLNMVDITLQRIPKSAKKVTVLGTRATLESEVYQKGLSCARLNYFFDAVWQEKVDEMLLNIKISSGHGVAIQIWKELREEMQVAGIDTVILACTDLNVVVDPKRLLLKVIDSSQALAEAIVHQWRNV
jgi:aspartate racemase